MSQLDYQATLDFLFSQLPMYQRVGASAFKKDLTNTKQLCKFLGNPERSFKSIHVAGTNGKGSTSHMLAAVLQSAGYKTGLYTSPHLKRFTERIKINGMEIAEHEVIAFTEQAKPLIQAQAMSFFELTVGMAFDHFKRNQVDIAIIETGLGGRLDSTNVITPILSVITNIGWDHMEMLGDTLPLIATEKAGIIKADVPVIVGETQKEVSAIFEKIANERRSLLKFADQFFTATRVFADQYCQSYEIKKGPRLLHEALTVDLAGHYQHKNVLTVLAVIEQLTRMGWTLEEEDVKRGLAQVKLSTGFLGRWTVLGESPMIIADTAHNAPGLGLLFEQISGMVHDKLHFVISVLNDKALDKILKIMPKNAIYYFSKSNIPRGLDAYELARQAQSFNLYGEVYASVQAAFEAAKRNAGQNDLILVGGSTFTVAEVL